MLVRGHTQGFSIAWEQVLAAERAASPTATPGELREWEQTRQRNRRAEKGRSDRPQRKNRPSAPVDPVILQNEAHKIGSMLSRGYDPATVRRKLGLSRRQWDIRMGALSARDRATIWAKSRALTDSNLRLLATVRRMALDATRPAFGAAIRATVAMHELQWRLVAVAQSLGDCPRVQPEPRVMPDNQDAPRDLPNLDQARSAIQRADATATNRAGGRGTAGAPGTLGREKLRAALRLDDVESVRCAQQGRGAARPAFPCGLPPTTGSGGCPATTPAHESAILRLRASGRTGFRVAAPHHRCHTAHRVECRPRHSRRIAHRARRALR